MSYTLKNTSSLDLIVKDEDNEENIQSYDFTKVGEDKLVSKPTYKGDDEIREVNVEASVEGKTVTATVTYSSGMEGLEVQDVNLTGVASKYEIESEPEFSFQECDD